MSLNLWFMHMRYQTTPNLTEILNNQWPYSL
jgi:hypothetical protein